MRKPKLCPKCKGSGQVPDPRMPAITGATKVCPVCDGTGYVEG